MSNLLKEVFKRLFQVFIFLLPVQLGYHFWPSWAFVFGIRVDYLSPTLYLTDILFLCLLLVFLIIQKSGKKLILWGLIALTVLGMVDSYFSLSFLPAIIKWIKVFELFCLATIIVKTKELKIETWILKPLFYSLAGVSALGILQVIKGGSLGGALYFLGERAFSLSTPGIALASLGGRQFLRAYSVFSHPNSLAGFLGVGLILCLPFVLKRAAILKLTLLAVILVTLLLTFSLAPGVSLLAVLITLFFLRKKPLVFSRLTKGLLFFLAVGSIALPLLAARNQTFVQGLGESYSKRAELAIASGKMFSEKPFLGVGLNNFTIALPQKGPGQPLYWWLQPVHNIFLLSLSEGGLLGFLILILLFYLAVKKASARRQYLVAALLFIFMTGFFDHYWLSLHQNQLLLAVVLGLSFKNG